MCNDLKNINVTIPHGIMVWILLLFRILISIVIMHNIHSNCLTAVV